ncbi:MAG: oligopeptide transporter, OPT family [Acidobacteriota bacterium]
MAESSTNKGLSHLAYRPLEQGETYEPYVPASSSPAELTLKAIVTGIACGIAFGAANAYLGLRVGLTISTSIPVAVLTLFVFRLLASGGVKSGILEANLSQTTGSASSSIASGIIFTTPALFLWGLEPDLIQLTTLGLAGGLLGVLFMIPLRRFLIAGEHGKLPYPEGTACAEVLVASEAGGDRARSVFIGLGVGALVKAVFGWLHALPDRLTIQLPLLKKGEIGTEVSAALFGVGYILGPRIAAVMVGGGLLSWVVIIPLIAVFGDGRMTPLYPEATMLVSDMSPGQLWTRYVRYIGAGAVATAGILTLIRALPTMIKSFQIGSQQLRKRLAASGSGSEVAELRTALDLPLKVVGIGALVIIFGLTVAPWSFFTIDSMVGRGIAAVLAVICAFFFVTVSSRIVGLVGVTSNPTSGMTIATLLATAAVFLLLGWTDTAGKAAALTVGAVVAIAASIAGDTSQDLKTGFLLGATPRRQQLGELIGVLTSAVFICLTVMYLGQAYGFGGEELPAPQATLMKVVIDGVLEGSMPWGLVGIGIGLALIIELLGIPSLPFAVGVYLPVSTMVPIFFGGLLRAAAEKTARDPEDSARRRERGILLGSGLVGGEGLLGVLIAAYAVYHTQTTGEAPGSMGSAWAGEAAPWLALAAFAALVLYFWRHSCQRATE